MKYILKDGSIVDEITQDNHWEWVESIYTKREVLEQGKLLADLMAEKAILKSDTIENL
jgi:hypothetical protein